MTDRAAFTPVSRVLITTASLFVVIAGLREASGMLVPILMAVFLATISASPLFWLQRKGVPTPLALVIVISIVVLLGIITAAIVGSSLDEFSAKLPTYESQLREQVITGLGWAHYFGIDISKEDFTQYLDPGAAMGLITRFMNGLSSMLANVFLIALAVVFILIEATTIPEKLRAVLSEPEKTLEHFRGFIVNVNRYLMIKTAMSLLTGVVVTIWLWVVGVDFPILWGWLAFFLNFVPYVGSIIAAFPAVVLALLELGLPGAVAAGACYVVVNLVVGNVVEPKFLGSGLGLSTVVVFISLVFWGWVLGPVGMFLSVPLTMLVKIAFESNERSRWVSILLSAHAPDESRDK